MAKHQEQKPQAPVNVPQFKRGPTMFVSKRLPSEEDEEEEAKSVEAATENEMNKKEAS